MPLEPIRRILPQAVRSAGISEQVTAARVVYETEQVMIRLWGAEKAQYLQVISFQGGTLKLGSSSGAALQELKMQSVRFQNEINRVLGTKTIHCIICVGIGF